jgi:signal transduction histidine kinase/ligand-binding sensor domain-containing protein
MAARRDTIFSYFRRIPRCARLIALLLVSAGGCRPLTAAAAEAFRPGEPHYNLRTWDTSDGLPHNAIVSIAQGNDGFLWLVTRGPIARFDGLQFQTIEQPELRGSTSFGVDALAMANDGSLVVAANGAGVMTLRHGVLAPHPLSAHTPGGRSMRSLLLEPGGALWAITAGREVWRWQAERAQSFPLPKDAVPTLHSRFAIDRAGDIYVSRGVGLERYTEGQLLPIGVSDPAPLIASSSSGGVWFATAIKLGRVRPTHEPEILGDGPWAGRSQASALLEASGGVLWIGTAGGELFRRTDAGTALVQSFPSAIRDLLEDAEGCLWIATDGSGLNRLQPARFTLLDAGTGSVADSVGSVCEDGTGAIWLASRTGIRRLSGERVQQLDGAGWPSRAAAVTADAKGDVWLANGSALWRARAGSDGAPEAVGAGGATGLIRMLFGARDGSVWVGRQTGPLECYRNGELTTIGAAEGFAASYPQAIADDAAGRVWVGTHRGELFAIEHGRATRVGPDLDPMNYEIRALYTDPAGVLWIGTGGGGLLVRRDGRFARITQAQGLPDDYVSQILPDDFGALWFGSPRGLFKATRIDLLNCAAGKLPMVAAIHFDRSDGLPGISTVAGYNPTAWRTRAGALWFVSRKGLVVTNPAEHQAKRPPPRTFLEAIAMDGRSMPVTAAPVRSGARKFEFHYTAPAFLAPELVRFRYRLIGFDAAWSEPTTQRFASYSGLAPGHYEFQVIAGNHESVWGDVPASFVFDVLPRWWETWAARVLGIVVAAGGLTMFVRRWAHRRLRTRLARLEQKEQVETERARIARDLHDALGTSLTHAGMVAEEIAEDCAELRDAKTRSARLAVRLRTLARDLDAIVWAVSPKNDSLPALCAYLGHFATEFFRDSSIYCRVRTGENIPAIPLSPEVRHHIFMVARELMNNALKHSGASHVMCDMNVAENRFALRVADNGRGFSPDREPHPERNGVANLRFRAAELGGVLEWVGSAEGTIATLTLPLSRLAAAAVLVMPVAESVSPVARQAASSAASDPAGRILAESGADAGAATSFDNEH